MKKNNKAYALKEMSKVKIIDRRSEKSIKGEREFLSKLHHPFIVNMICAFQDYETLYLVMDLLTGGDLRYHLCRIQKFNEDETKFFISCLLLGLEYIHGNNIIHRDIKPENLVCDEKGYIRITDFGVAKIRKEDNSSETSGTPGYMAPEVLLAQNHSFPVDFFAIGIMGYEFMLGERPYIGRNRKEIKHLVLRKQAKIEEEDIPNGWSYESVDFINKCLRRKQSKRLGFENGVSELKDHEWFKDFNWDKLYNKKIKAPFIPKKGGNYDKKYCEAIEKISDTTFERYQSYMNQKNFGKIFAGYTFINYELIQNTLGIETNTRNTTNSKQQSSANHTNNTSYNDKNKLFQNNINTKNKENILINKNNIENNNYSLSPKENNINKYNNNFIYNNNKEKKEYKNEDKKEDRKEEKKEEKKVDETKYADNEINNPESQYPKKLKMEKKNAADIQLKIEDGDNNNKNNIYKNNLASNDSMNSNINNIKNTIKKISSFSEKEKINLRSSSVDVSSSNLKNNLSYNMDYIKQNNKELNMNYINNNYNKHSNKNDKFKSISGSLSNPNREKFTYKLKSNTGLNSPSMIIKKNNRKREISGLYNSSHKNHNNYIQFNKFNAERKNEFPFYLPNLNKNSNILNLYGFKKKTKINLNQLKFKLNLNNNYNHDFINHNNNKIFLSPTNKRLKKSESTSFIKSPLNSNKFNYGNNSNLFSPKLKRNFSNLSNKDNKITNGRNISSSKRKRIKNSNEGYK